MSAHRARLKWLCRRGMRELDLVLAGWLERCYDAADDDRRAAFESLLERSDPQLFDFLTGREAPPDPATAALVDELTALQQPHD